MKKILIFTLLWFILNLIQSIFTEIIDDEAYYWVYARFMDWGFYDHPPMIALLIKSGSTLFPGELGVRLLPSLLGAGTVFMVLIMLKDSVRDIHLLMLMIFTIPLMNFHVAGFIATPDLPLVFFTCLFFLFYRKYLEDESPGILLLLSLSIVLMMYSKYHAFLVIGFTILSNPGMLTKRSFWIIVVISILLYLPHIIWQIRHDFVSFSYHLIERTTPFQVRYLLEYIWNQVLLLGPVTGTLLLFWGITRKTTNRFEAALKFNLIGFFLFFLLSSLRGHVEPHWTAAGYIPLLLLSVPAIEQNSKRKKWVYSLCIITIPFIILLRLSIMIDFGFLPEKISHRFHHKKELYRQIEKEARGRPVVFTNSYQQASLYWFFTGRPAFSQNNKHYRKNQYDLLGLESDLQGREVLYFPRPGFPGCDTLQTNMGELPMHVTEYFCHFNRVEIITPDIEWSFDTGEKIPIKLQLGNPAGSTVYFSDSCTHAPWLVYSYFSESGTHKAFVADYDNPLPDLAPGEYITFPVTITAPEKPGKYLMMFSFGSKRTPAGINGKPVRIRVHSRSTGNSTRN